MTIAEQIRQEAKAENAERIALNMIDEGLDVAAIVRYTELTTDEVKNLMQKRSRP